MIRETSLESTTSFLQLINGRGLPFLPPYISHIPRFLRLVLIRVTKQQQFSYMRCTPRSSNKSRPSLSTYRQYKSAQLIYLADETTAASLNLIHRSKKRNVGSYADSTNCQLYPYTSVKKQALSWYVHSNPLQISLGLSLFRSQPKFMI